MIIQIEIVSLVVNTTPQPERISVSAQRKNSDLLSFTYWSHHLRKESASALLVLGEFYFLGEPRAMYLIKINKKLPTPKMIRRLKPKI